MTVPSIRDGLVYASDVSGDASATVAAAVPRGYQIELFEFWKIKENDPALHDKLVALASDRELASPFDVVFPRKEDAFVRCEMQRADGVEHWSRRSCATRVDGESVSCSCRRVGRVALRDTCLIRDVCGRRPHPLHPQHQLPPIVFFSGIFARATQASQQGFVQVTAAPPKAHSRATNDKAFFPSGQLSSNESR
jgi:hypothetical protein